MCMPGGLVKMKLSGPLRLPARLQAGRRHVTDLRLLALLDLELSFKLRV